MGTRCLIVDDSPEFLVAARRMLTSEGIGVVGVACDSAQAIVRVDVLQPDLVLVDVRLGAENGIELARSIDATARTHKRPVDVILISAYTQEDLRDRLPDSPAVGFLEKTVLSARAIRAVLESKRAASP